MKVTMCHYPYGTTLSQISLGFAFTFSMQMETAGATQAAHMQLQVRQTDWLTDRLTKASKCQKTFLKLLQISTWAVNTWHWLALPHPALPPVFPVTQLVRRRLYLNRTNRQLGAKQVEKSSVWMVPVKVGICLKISFRWIRRLTDRVVYEPTGAHTFQRLASHCRS